MSDRLILYKQLTRTLTPAYADKFENFEHAMAKSRIAALFRAHGYTTHYEYDMYCVNTIDSYSFRYRVDVYAELRHTELISGGIFIIKTGGITSTILPSVFDSSSALDRVVVEIGGINTYHMKTRKNIVRQGQKQELICKQHNIKPERYFILEKDEVFSRKYLLTDAELIAKLKPRN